MNTVKKRDIKIANYSYLPLAGLKPAWVKGANTEIRHPTVPPIRSGIKSFGTAVFFEFVNENIMNDSNPVPTASARNACFHVDTLQYSPNADADATLSTAPLTILLFCSNVLMLSQNKPKFNTEYKSE